MTSAPLALIVATLLTGGGIALAVARWKPELLGGATLGRPAWDPIRLWPVAALMLGTGLWTAAAFWQGTNYAPLNCAQVSRVAEALVDTDLSVRTLNRAVGEFVDAIGGLTRGARAAMTAAPIRARPPAALNGRGGP